MMRSKKPFRSKRKKAFSQTKQLEGPAIKTTTLQIHLQIWNNCLTSMSFLSRYFNPRTKILED